MAKAKKKAGSTKKKAGSSKAKKKAVAKAKKSPKKKKTAKKAASKKAAKKAAPKKAAPKKAAPKKAASKAAPKSAPAKPSARTRSAEKPPRKAAESPVKSESKSAQSKEKEKQVVKAQKSKPRKLQFSISDHVVYPTHGVGKITAVEEREVSGMHLEMFVVEFEKDKMILRVPVDKVETSGMRKLASPKVMEEALTTLKGRARIKRTMWSRRAQEYEAKINSGDPIAIAEVVRDLHRNASQPEQSYSERQIYEAALDRLVREVAAVEKIDEDAAQERLQKVLQPA